MPLERDINIAVNGPFWVEVANQEHPFTAMLISRSRGTCLIKEEASSMEIEISLLLEVGWRGQEETSIREIG